MKEALMKIMDTKLGRKAKIYLEWENTSRQFTTIKKLWHPKYYKLQRNNNLHFYNLFLPTILIAF